MIFSSVNFRSDVLENVHIYLIGCQALQQSHLVAFNPYVYTWLEYYNKYIFMIHFQENIFYLMH